MFIISPWHGNMEHFFSLNLCLLTKRYLIILKLDMQFLVEYLYENIPLTKMLCSFKAAKKHVYVYILLSREALLWVRAFEFTRAKREWKKALGNWAPKSVLPIAHLTTPYVDLPLGAFPRYLQCREAVDFTLAVYSLYVASCMQ